MDIAGTWNAEEHLSIAILSNFSRSFLGMGKVSGNWWRGLESRMWKGGWKKELNYIMAAPTQNSFKTYPWKKEKKH